MNIVKTRGFRMALASAVIAVALAFSSFGWSLAIAPNIDLGANQQNFTILGDRDHGYMSEVTGSADFNGDGFGDLLLGAGGYNKNGIYAGAAFVVFGGANLPATYDMLATKPALTLLGEAASDVFGHSVAAGDINGDGNKDIIVGADGYHSPANRGAVYVYLGGPGKFSPGAVVDLKTGGKVALKILGAADGDHFGRAVASGDVNGDGKEDIIVGAYEASPGAPARPNAGAIYVILGRGGLDNATPQTIDLSSDPNQAALRIFGATGGAPSISQAPENGSLAEFNPLMADDIQSPDVDRGDLLGRSLTTADINADGKADIIAGAQGANVNGVDTGRTYVFYGKATYTPGEAITLQQNTPTGANITINGVDAGDQSGFFVGKGKINNDNLTDILISSYLAKGPGNATGPETGEVYVINTQSPMPATIDLATAAYVSTIYGAKAGDRLGRSLSAGDVNGNGRDELILGASRSDALGRQDAGQVYVVYTELNLPKQVYMSNPGLNVVNILGGHSTGVVCSPDPAVSLSQDCSDEAGHSTSTGDINKDGKADVIVGALYANNGTLKDAGVAYVIYGGNFSLYFPLTRK